MSQPVAGHSFRDALAQFASGVTIVAAREGEQLAGLTATAFSAVSLEPPLVLVCVARTASAHDAVVSAERVGISLLAAEQGWVARQFARHGIDKFDGVPLLPDRSVPLVDGSLAHLECRRHARYEAGDHTIVVAEVVAASAAGGKPLVHYARTLGGFASESNVRPGAPATATHGEPR
jgi:3-hydroxy-9,10-secoandrosta-1,3,5(10)-triene-9,17-dione monooxygenase reductase component